AKGVAQLERALRARQPGSYQIQAAIAACHSTAVRAADTDWREIAGLYQELARYEPSPVVEANRAVAVAIVDGAAAGLAILDSLAAAHPQLDRWAQLHIARADMLCQLGRDSEAHDAYLVALELRPPSAEQAFIVRRIQGLRLSRG